MTELNNRRLLTGVALLALLASERAMAAGMQHMGHGAMPMDHSQMNHSTPPAQQPRTPLPVMRPR